MENRIKNIFNNIEKKIDAVIIKNSNYPYIDENLFYVTGLEKGIFEGAIAVLHPEGNIDLLVSELEAESASRSKSDIHIYKNKEEMDNIIKKLSLSDKNIGLNYNCITYNDYHNLKNMIPTSDFIDISKELIKTRLVKDQLELKLIKKACKISDSIMNKIPEMLHEGMYEYEIAAEIDYLMQKLGADKPAFETISSFNKNTSEPHYSHGNTRLKKGDFALFDFGACFRKYNSDITRTFIFGKASKNQKEMYETVLEAQKIGFDIIKADVAANKVHNAVSSYIDNTKFKGRFIHSTGHSLGLAVHDGARLGSENNMKLKENMIFTVEPGIYIPGIGGIRIEDDIQVKKEGIELLTDSSRELLEI